MYLELYTFLREYTPLILQRPFLFSSIYPVILNPLFTLAESYYPDYFVKRTKKSASSSREEKLYHVFTFLILCLLSLFDPGSFSFVSPFSSVRLPDFPPDIRTFLAHTIALILFYELVLSGLHALFHANKYLFNNIHYVHHLDVDPTAISATKLHVLEVITVYMVMYVVPVVAFDPHPFCLMFSFMVTSIMAICSHSGIKGWYLAEYHRKHHLDPRYNLWNPIMSYFDLQANTAF